MEISSNVNSVNLLDRLRLLNWPTVACGVAAPCRVGTYGRQHLYMGSLELEKDN